MISPRMNDDFVLSLWKQTPDRHEAERHGTNMEINCLDFLLQCEFEYLTIQGALRILQEIIGR